ncbi:MAG: hypothetical protein M1833_002218 [Piccolia ochrophora]|nr:MAG: hypothetical protein M1833_002218 [Piccolia ochrophora]
MEAPLRGVSAVNGPPTGLLHSAHHSPLHVRTGIARKRNSSIAGLDSSPGSVDEAADDDERKRAPGVKRACNECRQQKLRCDVKQDPFTQCSRCHRLKLDCKIESNFKRVGKRSKNAEMEREIVELRMKLATASAQTSPTLPQPSAFSITSSLGDGSNPFLSQPVQDQFLGSHEAVASLLDLRQGLDGSAGFTKTPSALPPGTKRLEGVILNGDRVAELFNVFFSYYHPILPLLDPSKPPEFYYNTSQFLFWTVISVAARRSSTEPSLLTSLQTAMPRLMWFTLGEVPQSYHIVKALCLLCTWPLPISSTSADPTFMLSGLMMHIAMQIGLHRPSHAQDFTKFHVQLREEELRDRVKTWATCNIVAQSVATGYGQPPSTLYDWTLETCASKDTNYRLPDELGTRLRIEKFCDKVTKSLYSSRGDPVGLAKDNESTPLTSLLSLEFEDLSIALGTAVSPAGLHLRLSAFFLSPSTPSYTTSLLNLYHTTTSLLSHALALSNTSTELLRHASNYILQTLVAAGFVLLKLLNSFFATHVDREEGKALFHRTIWAIREISVLSNDLPSRLAEVLAQLWRNGGGEGVGAPDASEGGGLMLKVRCRMSMSLVFDSVWRWREEFQAKGRGNLDSAVQNPTNPDSAADPSNANSTAPTTGSASTSTSTASSSSSSSSTSAILDATATTSVSSSATGPSSLTSTTAAALNPSSSLSLLNPALTNGLTPSGSGSGALTPLPGLSGFADTGTAASYEVFDPLNWMLDGFVDFPYNIGGTVGVGGLAGATGPTGANGGVGGGGGVEAGGMA